MSSFPENRLLKMLADKQVPLGMQCFTGSPELIEVMGHTGFDFVMLDAEHSGNNPRAMEALIRTADAAGLVSLVRVPDRHNETDIRRALEAGAHGLFIPMVRSAKDVEFAARAAFFPPLGMRGICPSVRAARYAFSSFEEFTHWNNTQTLIIPMIEHPEAVDNIDEICARDDVRMVVFGAGDLCYAMGHGTLMMKSPEVQAAYRKVLDSARRHGVAVIGGPVLDPTAAACRKSLDDGVTVFCLGLDTLGFRRFCEQTVNELHRGVAGSAYTRPVPPASGFHAR
ncbi:MAG: aldolase/citrate lyase family protein [Pseudomonadota bacterium]